MNAPAQDLRLLSGCQIARLIRERVITSREAVDAHIQQIEAVNPPLNAVVCPRFDEARREADQADELTARLDAEELPPFHGVPCTIKECFALRGMPNTSGLVSRRDLSPEADATAVARLRAAGAIPMGVTNVSELCMWMESDNFVYGRTNNPYDPRRIVGGSSGGEGAIIASGGSPFGLGSDIGGSIRLPAFFNGIFGHKPTGGLVPGSGQYPIADERALRFLTTGPLARRAEDLMPLLRILAGPDGLDKGCFELELGDPDRVEISSLRVLSVAQVGPRPVTPELRRAQDRVLIALAKAGARVVPLELPQLRHAADIWMAMMAEANETPFGVLMGQGTAINPLKELAKRAVGRSDHTVMATLLALGEELMAYVPKYSDRMIELGSELKDELARRLGDDGIMVLPSYVSPAPWHVEPVLRQIALQFNYAYTAILNVMELPASQVPVGLSARGLPLGVQIAARHGQDHLCIAAACALERELGGWRPPGGAGISRARRAAGSRGGR